MAARFIVFTLLLAYAAGARYLPNHHAFPFLCGLLLLIFFFQTLISLTWSDSSLLP
jgi:hypothetical protein